MSDRASEDAALAFLLRLDPATQHRVYERYGEALAVPAEERFSHRRVHRVARALHEAHHGLGRSPSVREYEQLRRRHPENDWPSEQSVKRWLGVRTWNNALVRIGLEAVVEGDVIETPGPQAFRPEEAIRAIQECAADIGAVPSYNDYFGWVRRPDVEDRAGRRPRSFQPFNRLFGSFREARIAAGLTDYETATPAVHAVIRVSRWGMTREELLEHIRVAAARVDGPMTAVRYERERRDIFVETRATGRPLALASLSVVYRHFRYWSAALDAAGLLDRPETRLPAVTKFSDAQMLSIVSRAYDETDEVFSCEAYKRWRERTSRLDPRLRSTLPHASTVRKHFGSWMLAVERLLEWRENAAQ